MAKKDENPGYVTVSECGQNLVSIKNEVVTIRKVLVGDDMQGGIVQEISDIKAMLK
ncbi:MAG: hypothetical protein IBV52_08635 [Candidatus Bathyarchaeota archaeon]